MCGCLAYNEAHFYDNIFDTSLHRLGLIPHYVYIYILT